MIDFILYYNNIKLVVLIDSSCYKLYFAASNLVLYIRLGRESFRCVHTKVITYIMYGKYRHLNSSARCARPC